MVALTLGVGAVPAPARADNIDMALLKKAPQVMEFLQSQGYKNVGVLSFQLRKGKDQKLQPGAITTNLATRLENALILLDDPDKPVGILHDPSRVALAKDRHVSLTPAGRRGLLEKPYPLAWGEKAQHPDALLTGEVHLSPDNQHVTVIVKAFDHKMAEPRKVVEFTTRTDRSVLGDCGQSFHLTSRQLRKRPVDLEEEAGADATKEDQSKEPPAGADGAKPAGADGAKQDQSKEPPALPEDNPVKLTILYNGQPVATEADPSSPGERRVRLRRRGAPGGGKVAEPTAGQKVEFTMENTSPSETFGIVLKVNGMNTLFEEPQDAVNCTKWVLEPGKKYTIRGYYTEESGQNLKPFKVLSDEETRQKEGELKDNNMLGLIEFHVFRQNANSGPGSDQMEISRKVSLRGQAPRAQKQARSLAERQAQVAASSHVQRQGKTLAANMSSLKPPPRLARQGKDRGLIVGEETKVGGGTLTRKEFTNLEEVSNQVITYHVRQGDSPQ
jgi:hypothetical protein